jgi:hypothetical protein
MKLKILDTAHHRNGVAGTGFDVVLFKVLRERGAKVGILFDDPGYCAVLDVTMLAAGDIAFGSNSWRGDDYEPALRRAIEHDRKIGHKPGLDDKALIRQRVDKFAAALRHYSDDELFSNLVDLLADAMHWSQAHCEDFHYALCLAGKHYVAEQNDQPITERKLP